MRALTIILGFVFVFLVPAARHARADEQDRPPTLRVMSFNVRLGVADDGDHRWERRKDLVAQTIAAFSPDVVGVQEMWPFQAEYLTQKLPEFSYRGWIRRPESSDQEQCGVLYRRDRFQKLEEGVFWLSETPEVAGSKSWDSFIAGRSLSFGPLSGDRGAGVDGARAVSRPQWYARSPAATVKQGKGIVRAMVFANSHRAVKGW